MPPAPAGPRKKKKTWLILLVTIAALAGIAFAIVTGIRISKETAESYREKQKERSSESSGENASSEK